MISRPKTESQVPEPESRKLNLPTTGTVSSRGILPASPVSVYKLKEVFRRFLSFSTPYLWISTQIVQPHCPPICPDAVRTQNRGKLGRNSSKMPKHFLPQYKQRDMSHRLLVRLQYIIGCHRGCTLKKQHRQISQNNNIKEAHDDSRRLPRMKPERRS